MSSSESQSESGGSEKVLYNKNDKSVEHQNDAAMWDDAELIKMYDRATAQSYEKVPNSELAAGASSSVSQPKVDVPPKWKVGDQCMAPYEEDGKWYPAQIESISVASRTCKVTYIGYDQKATVKMDDLMKEADRLIPNQVVPSQFPASNLYRQLASTAQFCDQIPPKKRPRLTVREEGFFKVPRIPQHILERRKKTMSHFNIVPNKKLSLPWMSPERFGLHRFLFESVPKRSVITGNELKELGERAIGEANRFCSSNHWESPDVKEFEKSSKLNEQNLALLATQFAIPENSTALSLYLEGIQERLKIESEVESVDEAVNEQEVMEEPKAAPVPPPAPVVNKQQQNGPIAPQSVPMTSKNINERKDAFPIPDLCPPPPPSLFGKIAVAGTEKEALTNMLMSWYMSGYHTGYYQGVMHEKMAHSKPK